MVSKAKKLIQENKGLTLAGVVAALLGTGQVITITKAGAAEQSARSAQVSTEDLEKLAHRRIKAVDAAFDAERRRREEEYKDLKRELRKEFAGVMLEMLRKK